MTVARMKEIALEWVADNLSSLQEFGGAYLSGSICEYDDDEEMPDYSDVDIHVVWRNPPDGLLRGKIIYEDVILDISHTTFEELGTHDSVLADYHTAFPFSRKNILVDPTGRLTRLQEKVAAEYQHPAWIRKRIEHALLHNRKYLDGYMELHQSGASIGAQAGVVAFAAGIMAHVILSAACRNPTVRKRYLAARSVLSEYGMLDYYETLLEFPGCRDISRESVSEHLVSLGKTLDIAERYLRTPYRFSGDISPAGRIIAIDGSRDLIERGFHREAVFYLVATYSRCLHVLRVDASEDVSAEHEESLGRLLEDLGMDTAVYRMERVERIKAELPNLRGVAEGIAGLDNEEKR